MRARPILVWSLIAAALVCVALAAYFGTARFDTSLEFRLSASGASRALLLLAFAPVVVLAIVLARRARRYAP
ncbi:MAG: hypothetical protein ABSG85_19795 [Spirochaetia bacterium]